MPDSCDFCKDHGERVAKSDLRDKKLESNCHAIEVLQDRVSTLEKLETHFEYMRKSMDQMQANHRESLKRMEKVNEKAIADVIDKVVQMQWIVRGVFMILLATFVRYLMTTGGSA